MSRRFMIATHYQQEHYLLVCDLCHGRRYIDNRICEKCEGTGSTIIPIPQVSFFARHETLKRVLFFAAAFLFVVALCAALLAL